MHHEESFWANPRTWVGVAFVLFVVIFGKKIWDAMRASWTITATVSAPNSRRHPASGPRRRRCCETPRRGGNRLSPTPSG